MIEVSNADRVVFPEVGRTKGNVVAYYERIASRVLPHLLDRPLSLRRFPKGLVGPGFFQKNIPAHYPASIGHFSVPRRPTARTRKAGAPDAGVTVYPVLRELEHLPYLANQGVIELHVPTTCIGDEGRPNRVVIDLDPPPGGAERARRAAHLVREALEIYGLASVPIATGSKGYHVVAPIAPTVAAEQVAGATQKLGALLAAKHAEDVTVTFRVAQRGGRVFVDWLRNNFLATVIAPWSLRARPKAPIATPLAWSELDTTDPDAFTIDDVARLLDRPDTLTELARTPGDAQRFVDAVETAFEDSGLVMETFDRFRS